MFTLTVPAGIDFRRQILESRVDPRAVPDINSSDEWSETVDKQRATCTPTLVLLEPFIYGFKQV